MQISVKQGNLDVSDDWKQTIEDRQLAILILNSESVMLQIYFTPI